MRTAKKVAIGIGIAVAAFFGLAIAAALYVGSQTGYAPGTVAVRDGLPDIVAETQQQKVQVNQLTFEVVNATKKNNVIAVEVRVENHGSTIEYVSWIDFRLIDGQKQLHEDISFRGDGEIAPTASRTFSYLFRVPAETEIADCQLVVLEDPNNLKYLDLKS